MNLDDITVLVVDDLEMSRRALVKGLNVRGLSVLEARSGPEALRMIANGPVDAVLLDIMMPGMNGTETLRLIRSHPEHAELPVLMVTADVTPETVRTCLENGANDYLTKPVDVPVTVARIRSQVERSRAVRELKDRNRSIRRQVEERTQELESINDELRSEIRRRRELETELRESRRRAEAANRAKSEFLATMSHELRTPLNSIIGFSDLIQLQAGTLEKGERLAEYASYINDGGSHLLGIVNDILDLSKIDAGRTELNESHIAVADLIERSVRMVNTSTTHHEVAVHVDPALDEADVFCDEILMRRALVNLIGNAVKFSEPRERIDVRAVPSEGDLRISVTDRGIGIAEEDIPKVLEPFGQAGSELSRSHVGTGLGVPLTKSLVELHDGRFEIESEPGVGTTVTLILPGERLVLPKDAAAGGVAANSAA
ncbi:MAG: response regulator [Minwuia sp.]|uniref:hybrid sensor histidine kinase/response regulator n=1 Tax=Minwuia sp. TaxID=2493630 RepID=UPI003A8ABE66